MKRKGMLFFVVAMMFTLFATSALAAQTIKVTIDGKDLAMEQPPVEQQGRTLVPMRAIFEALGAKVDWDGQTQAITATKGDVTIKMAIDQKNMTVNEEAITLDVAPTLVNDSTMVPARAVAESFDAKVDWNAANQQVIITTAAEEAPSTVVKTVEDSVKAEDGTVLMTVKATYPVLDNVENVTGINTINAAFQKMAEDYVAEVKKQYGEEVEASYIKDKDLFRAYAFEMTFEVTFDDANTVSVVTSKYADTAGAHPNTIKDGFTYDKATGKEKALTDMMKGTQAEIQAKVIAEFEKKIDANAANFFEGAKDTLQKEIANVEFYMAKDGVHFFFQLYTIAPYAAGFQEVVFPYADGVTVYVPAADATE